MELLGLGRTWQITIMISRYTEGIDFEKPVIVAAIEKIQLITPISDDSLNA